MAKQRHDNNAELIAIRTHLTVALLSLEMLQRRYTLPEDAVRLCAYTTEALSSMREELARLDGVLARLEARAAHRAEVAHSRCRDAADTGDAHRY